MMTEQDRKSAKPWRSRVFPLAILVILIVVGLWYWERLPRSSSPTNQPAELVTWVDRGLTEEAKAEFDLRIQTLEASLESDPELAKDISKWLTLGNLKYASGDLAGAKEAYEHILKDFPDDAPAHENIGQTLKEMGDLAGAESHWRRALAIAPYEGTYLKLADLIETSFPERRAQIQPLLEEAIATLGQTPALLVRLGDWYRSQGDYERALSHYKVALQLDPGNESLEQLIEQTKQEQKANTSS